MANLQKRALTADHRRRRSRGSSPSVSIGNEQDGLRRLSRSPVQKGIDLSLLARDSEALIKVPKECGYASQNSRQAHLDPHRTVFEASSDSTASTESRQYFAPRRKPKRTHHDLHLMIFDDTSQDFIPELPSLALSSSTRQRNRSGTVVTQSQPLTSQYSLPPSANATTTGRSRRPSISNTVNVPISGTMPSPGNLRFAPLPLLNNIAVRNRSSSISESPLPFGNRGSSLSRVHSTNAPAKPDIASSRESHITPASHGLNRSRSMSDAHPVGVNR